MMFRKSSVLVVLLILVHGLNAQTEPEQTTFFMTFVPNVQFAQMYVGIEQGFFADAGYELELEYGREPDGVDLIAAGQRKYGLISGEQVIIARANNRSIVSVYEWWQRYPVAIVLTDGSGIETPADLAGRRVGVPGRFGATYSGLVALLSAIGLDEADIQLEEIGFNAPEVVCIGAIEAAAVYGNNEPLQIASRADSDDCGDVTGVTVFNVADYADLVSNGLVTSEAVIADEPERVAAMVSAFDRSVHAVIENPARAYLLSEPYIDNLPMTEVLRDALMVAADEQDAFLLTDPSRDEIASSREALFSELSSQFAPDELLQFQILLETVTFWDAERTGFAEGASWELTQDILLQIGFLEESIDVTTAFNNEFLP
jgi:NitT/TauT family transport system substrate-binding protein